ncbi:MAG: radical SAM protein [Myxococcales bacterium]|nr:radical SAM protein [Myxococcales bacterium]
MGVEVRPLGVRCNLSCVYCYQNPQRDAGNVAERYDMAAITRALEGEEEPFTLFGGEPLLLPKADLERLLALGLQRHGYTSIQTNAALIDDEHLDLFRRYRVQVGVSIDGPGELNDARWAGGGPATRELTARAEAAIERLCAAAIPTSLIITLHRGNAGPERLPRLVEWLSHLDAIGVHSLRLHVLEVESPAIREALALTPAEDLAAHRAFAAARARLGRLKIDVFSDIDALLRGQDEAATCVWRACDPYTTAAVQGLEGDGQRSNCGRTNKDGVDYVKAEAPGFERYLALWRAPEAEGGCRGCRYFILCKGYCPGTAEGGDWRARGEHCGLWKELFAAGERELLAAGEAPITLHPRRHAIERMLVGAWARGINMSVAEARARVEAASPKDDGEPEALPETRLRLSWVSDRAAAVWGPRLRAAARAVREVEIEALRRGIVPALVTSVAPRERAALEGRLARDGLGIVDLDRGRVPARDLEHPVAIARPPTLARLLATWADGSEAALARLLGAPPCCAARWEGADADARRDLVGEVRSDHDSKDMSFEAPIERAAIDNPLLRRLGLRATPHMPCGPGCADSHARARALAAIAAELGLADALAWRDQALAWPCRWSALHGYAELVTPVVRAVYPGAYAAARREVALVGTAWPDEAAQGVVHPFRPPPPPPEHAARRQARGLALLRGEAPAPPPSRPRRSAPRPPAPEVAWARMAEPQEDGYDAEIALALATRNCTFSGRAELLRWPIGDAPTIADGAIAVRHISRRCPLAPTLENGPLTHPNIALAVDQVRRWPAIYRQLQRLCHTLHPLIDPAIPEARWPEVSGSCSHTFPEWFGAILATIYDPLGLAQALVHELAHTKLRALGVDIERARGLITNDPAQRFESPIRTDIPRPMSAVFHAEYSFIHVTELDLRMLDHAEDDALRRRLLALLARNVPRMRAGLRVIEGAIEVDRDGERFVDAFLGWARRVLDEGERRLAGAPASPGERV